LVRIKENGDIEYHGRIDNQVKLRGLRVELGEIESVIGSYPGIRSTIVIVLKKETEYLAAYFTADNKIDIDDLKANISTKLTAYMVPQVFMQLDEMPLTANGKIDKKALPDPGTEAEKVEAPRTDRQKTILKMVKETIGDISVGITTDLFSAGLSSLGCIKLCTMLTEEFGKYFTISELFENKTIVDIENLLEAKEEAEGFELREEYPLSMTQRGIFVESIHYRGTVVYNIPFLYELDSEIQMDRLKTAVEKTLAAHPYLSMTLRTNAEGDVFAVRSKEIKAQITEGKALPPNEELIRPFDLTKEEPLCRIGLYDTEQGKYLFIDTHHILNDGESLRIFLEDIDSAYMGEELQAEEYTGFEAALYEEKERGSDRFNKAKEWYDKTFKRCGKVMLPAKERIEKPTDSGNCTLIGNIPADEIRSFCEKNRFGLNAFFNAAMGLSLKAYTGSKNAVFATIYNGRRDSRLERSIGMFVKTLPVIIKALPEMSVEKVIEDCQSLLVNSMVYDIFSFAEICSTYGLNSDVLFAYQGDLDSEDVLHIGGKVAKEKELTTKDATTKSPFGLDIYIKDNKVFYEFEYDQAMYGRTTIDRFYRIMEAVTKGLISVKTLGNMLDLQEFKVLHVRPWLNRDRGYSVPDIKTEEKKEGTRVANESKQCMVFEDQVLEIYRKVLNNDEFGPDDNFFEFGGTSLLAAKVMMALMVKDFPVVYQDIFDEPTPRSLAAHVFAKSAEHWNEETVSEPAGADETADETFENEYKKALSHNVPECLDGIKSESLGTVLLTGTAGFLGIHVLKELIDNGTEKIYCLLRGGKVGAMRRLRQCFFYYFNDHNSELFGDRIVAIDGDITSAEDINALKEYHIDTLINCAASVKHFAELEYLKKVNVHGVENLVNLCLEKHIRLVHISTVSVCGERYLDSEGNGEFRENNFDIGQIVEDNGYVYSKFLGEKCIFDAIEHKGLDAKIIRMGNLMSRYEDGEFQINFNTNNFMNTLKSYVVLGCFPVQEMDETDEFSPIDEVAKATVLLAGTNSEYTVFHAYNSHTIRMGDLVQALNDNGLTVNVVDEKEFNEKLNKALLDDRINSHVSPLVNYKTDNDENLRNNEVFNDFTVKALYRLGFHWHITDKAYIDNAVAMLETLGFFDVE
ncbi:MAG: SDR family oxidoreductase, partial [Lachnospiraceae bacterium]|nr:SDR family oxidoreductase [Lachnospiraceae bacterium]